MLAGQQRLRSEFRRLVALVVIGVVAISMLSAAWACCSRQTISLQDISLTWGLSAAILYAMFCVANAWGWWLVLTALAHRMSAAEAIYLWIRCEALRWLPGSIWNFGARALEMTRRDTPHVICAASMVLELLFAVSGRMLIVLGGCLVSRQELYATLARMPLGVGVSVACAAVLLAGIIGILVIAPRGVAEHRWRRRITQHIEVVLATLNRAEHTACKLAIVQCYYLATTVLNGFSFVCVVRCVHPDTAATPAALIAVNSAAWLVGFFAIFSPGGLVVREAFLATALAGWFSPAESIAIAVSWRVLQIVVEAGVLAATQVTERPGEQASIRPFSGS